MDFRRWQDYQVEAVPDHMKVNVIVLGGVNDLSDSMRRLLPGCEHDRMVIDSYGK